MKCFMSEAEELEFLITHPFCGGDGSEGDGSEGGGSAGVVEGDAGDRSGSSPDRGRDSSQWIPKHRFDEVNGKFRQAEAFRQELQKLGLSDLQAIQQLKQRADELGKDRVFTDSEKEKLRKELEEVAPEVREFREWRESQKKAVYTRSEQHVNKFVKELGWEDKVENNHYLQDFLAPIIQKDQDLLMQYRSGEIIPVLDEAWKRFKTRFGISQIKRQQDAKLQAIKQGTVQPKNQQKDDNKSKAGAEGATPMRDSLNEAGDKAFDMLQALEE